MAWPGQHAVIKSLGSGQNLDGKITKVELLGHKGHLKFAQNAQALTVTMPSEQPGRYAFSLKISGLNLS